MHHRPALLLRRAKTRERLGLDVEVVARAVGAPFHGYEALAQIVKRLGGILEREFLGAVEVGPVAADAGVEGFGEGVVDDADGGGQVDCEAEGDADVRVAVDEVSCSVYGVDDECGFGREALAGGVGFFAHEAVRIIRCGWNGDGGMKLLEVWVFLAEFC